MLRRKQKKSSKQRNVHDTGRAQVFSYYANRRPESSVAKRSAGEKKSSPGTSFRVPGLRKLLTVMPSLIASLLLIASFVYITTLNAEPIVQVRGQSNDYQKKLLTERRDMYQQAFSSTLADSPMNRSKLLINTEQIASQLSAQFPELGDISVVLPLVGRRPIFNIKPAAPALLLNSGVGGPYVVDTTGRALADTKQLKSALNPELPVVRDESGLPVESGRAVLPADTVAFIGAVTGQLKEKHIKVKSIVLPQTNAGAVHVKLKNKPYFIKFDLSGEGRTQAGTFLAVKGHLERQGLTPANYIDVRVPEKAYYR